MRGLGLLSKNSQACIIKYSQACMGCILQEFVGLSLISHCITYVNSGMNTGNASARFGINMENFNLYGSDWQPLQECMYRISSRITRSRI